eukprot:TRINITY_DN4626_c0_g1_i1.p1 TRINITY_DN4626_c0_g1~~TRINITY_DN4626_c0_g1_i1.p1  ORF type:complete len:859 (+),score=123.51 TRINITY_DN4626_c0_g1_i1:107-2683(+)
MKRTLSGTPQIITALPKSTPSSSGLSLRETRLLSDRLASYVNSEEFSDVQFLVGAEQTKFYAHKIIVAAASLFFKQLFFESIEEKPSGLIITLADVRPDAFFRFLDYCYTGSVHLGLDYSMLLELMGLANRFGVVSLLKILLEHIESDKSVVSLIGMDVVDGIRRKYFPDEARPRALSESAAASPALPTITSGISPTSSSQSPLAVSTSPSVKPVPTDGDSSFDDAFEESGSDVIQYNSTKKQVEFSEKILRRIKVAKQKIEQQARKMKPDEEELEWNLIRTEAVRPRTSHTVTSYGNALVVIGGEDGAGGPVLPAVEFLYPDPPANNANAPAVVEPKKTGVGPKSLFSHATVRVGNKFYIYGGFVEGELSSKIYIMTVINDDTVHWSQPRITGDNPPPLKGHSLLRYDKRLVLFGGTDGKSFFNDSFFFHTDTNRWKKLETTGAPPCARAGHCSIITGHDQMLVIGGHDGTNFFNDIFKLALDTGTWTQITTKATVPRMAYHDAVRVGRNILIYGGQRKSGGFIKEMWKLLLDRLEGEEIFWTKIRCQGSPSERSGHAMIRIGSRLYVVGGISDKKPLGDLWESNTVKLPLEKARVIDHSEIEISSVVGAGNFSQVRKGFWNNQLVAFKMIKSNPKEKNRQKAVQDFKSEVELLSQLKHPNLVNFLGYCLDPNAIIMEYLPQNLHDFLIENRSRIEKQQLVDFAYDIANAMTYLHQNNIIHRDLKSFNILLDENLNVKVADFGIARVKSNTSTMTTAGTVAWTSPEILRHETYNEKSDVYSFAIVLWEMLSEGEIPFDDFQSPMEAGIAVATGKLRPPIPAGADPNWINLLERCWQDDPSSRPSFQEIMTMLKNLSV